MTTAPHFNNNAIFSEVSTPTEPDSGYLKVYAKSGALCSIVNGASEKTYAALSDLSAYLPLAGGNSVGTGGAGGTTLTGVVISTPNSESE